jgi:hypothetical protein
VRGGRTVDDLLIYMILSVNLLLLILQDGALQKREARLAAVLGAVMTLLFDIKRRLDDV